MSSEILGGAENVLKGNLGGAWDIKHGYADAYTDLGVARRFGGATAAYSLRDIGAMNGEVVRVRREPHDTSAGIDDEINFSANQVSSGALEDWVNGKLEDTLPADVATAAAAYSLRKVKADYSGNAVRVRRSSDSVEVNVAFDSDDKVSASSTITNTTEQGGESGSTTATTVAEFLSEERTTFITNPVMSKVSGDITVLSNDTSSTEFTFTFSGSTGDGFVRHNGKPDNLGADIGDTVTFDVTASGLSQNFGVLARRTSANNDAISPAITNLTNGTQTVTFTVSSGGPVGYLCFNLLATASTGTIRVHNLKVVGKSAFVHTWYDQAGSNNLTQDTASNQPKIAENGALLSQGIQYDGSVDRLSTASGFTYAATDSLSFFIAGKNEGVDNRQTYLAQGDGTGTGRTWLRTNETNNKYLTTFNGSDNDFGDKIQDGNYLLSFIYDESSSTIDLFQQVVQSGSQLTSITNTAASGSLFLGCNKSESNRYEGSFKEVIVYLSDQSANRFKIESNINNYYGLYNDANELTEDFEGGSTSSSSVSGQTFVANGKDGFTITTSSSASGEGGFTTLANVLTYKISFNAKLNGNDLNIARRVNKHSSGSATQFVAITEGFNTYDFLTDGGGSYQALTFTTSDNNATITISDFKISAIARNGFVETWYDQSGNSRPLIQTTATEQPSIVKNGGFLGGVKADVATSNSTMQNLQVSTDGVNANFGTDDWANGGTKLGLMYVGSVLDAASPSSTSVLWGGGRGVSSFQKGGVSIQFIKAGTDSFRLKNERQDLSPSGIQLALSKDVGSDDAIIYGTADNRDFTIKVNDSTTSDTLEADLDVREDQALSLFGAYANNDTPYYQRSSSGVCKECYLFSGDNITEVDTISLEINKHYNIYT